MNVNLSNQPTQIEVTADYTDNFSVWLNQSKSLWDQQKETKKNRKERKRKRGDVGNDDDNNKRRKVGNNGNDGYFRLQQRLDELYSNCWQIVQIVSLESAGKYALWIYVNNRLRRIKLQVKDHFM